MFGQTLLIVMFALSVLFGVVGVSAVLLYLWFADSSVNADAEEL